MPNKKVEKAINDQIQREFYSAYLYLAMSAYCESINLGGFSAWMRAQAEEEREHAMRLVRFLQDTGGRVELQALEKPPVDFKSPLKMFQAALEHEQEVTASVHRIYELARAQGDHATEVELQWFVREQVEEEKTAGDIVEMLKMVGDQPAALLMADRRLGSRAGGAD